MFKPELFQKANSVSRTDTLESIDRFEAKIRWKRDGSVIDLGCGDGVLTAGFKTFVYTSFSKIVGCDISEEMVSFANKRYGDEKTTFEVFDLGGEVPANLRGSFDQAFSAYAFHWVRNQERAFSNVYTMLKDDGDCLLVFPASSDVHDFYIDLSRMPKWSHWFRNVHNYISPYHTTQYPEKQIAVIMNKVGFTNVEVKCTEKSFVNDFELFRTTMEAICPFKIPLNMQEEFMEDYMAVVRDRRRMHTADGETMVTIDYRLIEAFGRK